MSTLTNKLGTTQPTPARRLVAVDSDPLMAEALRRVRREQAVAHTEQAAGLAEAAGWTEGAAGFRADATRMRQAITS